MHDIKDLVDCVFWQTYHTRLLGYTRCTDI